MKFTMFRKINFRAILTLLFFFLYPVWAIAQPEFSTGYAVNRHYADGAPIQMAYELKIKNRFYTKPQVGFKYLYYYNDFVGTKHKVCIWEFHQTLSYELIKKKKFVFKPNLGVNFRYYTWKGKVEGPLNTLPQRQQVIYFRKYKMRLNSYGNKYADKYSVFNPGFTIHLQTQFKITDKIWMHVTPFLEPDYDRIQNTGGCYIGVILKKAGD